MIGQEELAVEEEVAAEVELDKESPAAEPVAEEEASEPVEPTEPVTSYSSHFDCFAGKLGFPDVPKESSQNFPPATLL